MVAIATSINVGAEISLSGDGEISAPKTDKKRIQYFWSSIGVIAPPAAASPPPPTGALRAPAARAGGKAAGSVLMIVSIDLSI